MAAEPAAARAPDLRRRLALALLLLCAGVCSAFALATWAGYVWLENRTLEQILGRELDVFIEAGTLPSRIPRERTGLALYRPARVARSAPPIEIMLLPPGSYADVRIGEGRAHVLVRDAVPGDRVWLTYDTSELHQRERWALLALIAGVLIAALVAWQLSGRVARRALLPLDRLAQRLAALQPASPQTPAPALGDDDALGLIVRTLERRTGEVERLVQRERAFAGAAAHELRTPLTSISIAAETLAAVGAQPAAAVERIGRAVTTATQDLDALLSLSRSHEALPAQPVALHELLPQLADAYAPMAQQNGTQLRWQLAEVHAQLPPSALGIVFTNLLRNAIRAAPQGEVRITLEPGRIEVADNGEGIPAHELAQVFEPGTHGKNGGSGIGLYISRALAERCGWQLSLRCEAGCGTVAELRLYR